jgi:hypothetical protein
MFKKVRLGYYLEVDMEGIDVMDAHHRLEDALHFQGLPVGEGKDLISVHSTGTAHGQVRKFITLHAHVVEP